MSLKQIILDKMKAAMKDKDSDRLNAIRFLQAAVKNKEIEVRPNEITDEDILAVVKKLVKQHKDSIEQFTAANRTDLSDNEAKSLKVLEEFLPAQLSTEQIEALVVATIQELNIDSPKQMGVVMKAVIAKSQGAADNKIVSEIIKAKLQG